MGGDEDGRHMIRVQKRLLKMRKRQHCVVTVDAEIQNTFCSESCCYDTFMGDFSKKQ